VGIRTPGKPPPPPCDYWGSLEEVALRPDMKAKRAQLSWEDEKQTEGHRKGQMKEQGRRSCTSQVIFVVGTSNRNPIHQHKKCKGSRAQVALSVILATQEAEIRRTMVQSQPRQIVHDILS
jgi:hypothetical protein